MNRNKRIAKTFRKAADNMMRFGLEKYYFGDDYRCAPKCVLGHCCFVEIKSTSASSYKYNADTPAIGYLYCNAMLEHQIPIVELNDDPETTKHDMASLLLSEAVYLENKDE